MATSYFGVFNQYASKPLILSNNDSAFLYSTRIGVAVTIYTWVECSKCLSKNRSARLSFELRTSLSMVKSLHHIDDITSTPPLQQHCFQILFRAIHSNFDYQSYHHACHKTNINTIYLYYLNCFNRYRPTPIEDKDSDDNGDKLYTNPVYSLYDNAHSQPDLLVGTPTGHLSQETQQAQESIDEYEEFEGDSNRQLYAKPLRRQDRTERNGDNRADTGENNLPGHAVLYDDEEYNALDFNRDKFPKTTQNCPKSQTYKPSFPENSSETITDDAFEYGVLECPGVLVHGGAYSSTSEAIDVPRRSTADSKAPRYENSKPGVPSEADQMEEGPEYYSYQGSLEVRPEDESSIEHARSAAEVPREVDFEPIYSDEVYGDIQ